MTPARRLRRSASGSYSSPAARGRRSLSRWTGPGLMSSRRSSAPRMRPWTRGRFARSSEAGDKPKSEGASRIDVHTESPRRVLAELGVRPRKGLGQHFLVDSRVAARHIAYAKVGPSDVVLEIGLGLGVLTRELVVPGG